MSIPDSCSNMSTIFIDEDHAKNMLLQMWQQCESEELCDVVLTTGSEKMRIPAHRFILSIASEFFKKMFTSKMCESSSKEVKMTTTNGSILRSLVEYCYKGCVEINEDIVVEMLEIAHMLFLNNVVTACANFLAKQLHPTNCLGFAILAERYGCKTLLRDATDYSLEHFLEVSNTDEFHKLNAEQLGQLLASDNLCVSNEEYVFNSLMKWIKYDQTEREKYKEELLRLVRMPLLEKSFLIQHVRPVCTSVESLQIYMDALEFHILPQDKIVKQRAKSDKMLAMTVNETLNEMYIHYFCPKQLKWMKWLKNLDCRCVFGVAVMENNLYIIGGHDGKTGTYNTVICLNLETMISSEICPLIEDRSGLRAAVLKGCLYAVGGRRLKSVEKWSPLTKVWTQVASMSNVRSNFGIATLNEKLYVVGGDSNSDFLNSAECYDPDKNVWNSIAPMHKCRNAPGIVVAKGLLYAIGGFPQNKTVERYDPVSNEWTFLCDLSEDLHGFQPCIAVNGEVVVCYRDRIEKYNAATNQWISSATLNSISPIHRLFSYSGKLLMPEFVITW